MADIIIEQLPKYDCYKYSGVEWLGELPNEWSVTPLKFVLALISEKESSKNSQLPYLGMENIESWTGKIISGESEVEGLASRFFANDILFGKLRPYLAKVALMKDDGICSTELLVYRAKSNPKFFKYLLGSELFISLVNASTYGSKMPRANSNFIGNQKLPIPSQDEMVAISSYLDNKTTQINEAIAIKQKQIELLKERKQIIIQQAVTQGLKPDVPMKDSGVDWTEQIPKHWQMKRVKHIFEMVMETAEKNNSHELLSVYSDIGVKPRKELEERGNKASSTDGYWMVKSGDIIVNKLLAWMGAIGLSEYDGVTSPAYDILRPRIEVDGYFYHLLFRAKMFSAELKRHSRGIMDMRLRLYFDKFGVLEVPYPPIEEQREIVRFVKRELSLVDDGISLFEQQINKLKEYKTTLINSAVTGKIKVTEQA
ncbi:restriction endonuclease subunit S [Vibrio vulnificus]|uniref:restriction endonuclease subunit S n=1 Tax=Vibrio vulnificus TaxID=672 RepID=UPI0005FB446C|nr:restriction endonuclease subunit S [Vibrio vulnificus]